MWYRSQAVANRVVAANGVVCRAVTPASMVAMMAVEVHIDLRVAVWVATQMAAVVTWVVRLVLGLVLDVVHGRHLVVPLADVVRHRRLNTKCAKRF